MTLLDSNRQKVSGNFFQSLIPFVIKLFLSLKLLIAGEGMVMEPDKVAFLAMVYFRLGSELTNRNVSVHENKL